MPISIRLFPDIVAYRVWRRDILPVVGAGLAIYEIPIEVRMNILRIIRHNTLKMGIKILSLVVYYRIYLEEITEVFLTW